MKRSGIYQIRNVINGHLYIGSAADIARRWKWHRNALRAGNHHSVYLQRAFNRYGEASFVFSVLLECREGELIENEQRFLDSLKPVYNLCQVAGSPLGYKHTEETRQKVSQSLLGNKRAAGIKHSPEWKLSNALRMLGNKHGLGVKQTDESNRKRSESGKGKNKGRRPWLGKSHSEETKQKMSAAQKGKPKSEETKRNMSLARLRYFEKKREEAE